MRGPESFDFQNFQSKEGLHIGVGFNPRKYTPRIQRAVMGRLLFEFPAPQIHDQLFIPPTTFEEFRLFANVKDHVREAVLSKSDRSLSFFIDGSIRRIQIPHRILTACQPAEVQERTLEAAADMMKATDYVASKSINKTLEPSQVISGPTYFETVARDLEAGVPIPHIVLGRRSEGQARNLVNKLKRNSEVIVRCVSFDNNGKQVVHIFHPQFELARGNYPQLDKIAQLMQTSEFVIIEQDPYEPEEEVIPKQKPIIEEPIGSIPEQDESVNKGLQKKFGGVWVVDTDYRRGKKN